MLERRRQDVAHAARLVLACVNRLLHVALRHRVLDVRDELLRHQLARLHEHEAVHREIDRHRTVAEEGKPQEHAHDARTKDDVVETATGFGRLLRGVRLDLVAFLVNQLSIRNGRHHGSAIR